MRLVSIGLLCLTLAGCADYNDRIYREGMAKYNRMIAADTPRGGAAAVSGATPYQNPRPKTFAVYDRYGRFQGTIKERGY